MGSSREASPVLPEKRDVVMKLDARTVPQLKLPDGKDDVIFWDSELSGYGYRLRRSGDRVRSTFIAQYRHHGATRRFLIGGADKISPAQAREHARKILAKAALGHDPQQEKADQRCKAIPHSLNAIVGDYLAMRKAELRPNTFDGIRLYLTGPYFRSLHATDISAITRRDVAVCLNAIIRAHGNVTAARARTALSTLFRWCLQQGLVESNPVFGTATPVEPGPRERELTDEELAAVWNACGDDDFGRIIRLLILTGARRAEIGGMRWSEFDFDKETWMLPAVRSKNGLAHTLPLHSLALGIIQSTPQQLARDHLFGALSPQGFTSWHEKASLDQRAGIAEWNIHDLRRTAATRMADIGIAPHIIEEILNHKSGHKAGIAGIYNRSTYARDVRAALARWEDHIRALITGEPRKVIPLEPRTA
jgi:integrase